MKSCETFLANVMPMKDDEYWDENIGDFVCKVCHTPTTAHDDEIHPMRIRCWCKCKKDADEKRQEEVRNFAKQQYIQELKEKSLLGELYRDASFETTDTDRDESFLEAMEWLKKYCNNAEEVIQKNYGLYLYGNIGLGKTHLMACMIDCLTKQFFTCYTTNFMKIQQMVFNGKEEELMRIINNVDFLFIDDIGVELITKDGKDSWLQSKVYDIINTRYNRNKPVIASSNYSKMELYKLKNLEDRTLDRLNSMTKKDIKIEGKSYRRISRDVKLSFDE